MTASHQYGYSVSTVDLTLVVTDNDGMTGTTTHSLVLPPLWAPEPVFYYEVSGLHVDVDAAGALDPDGTIVSYVWNWGDGSPDSNGVMASHDYPMPGIYVVTLTVTDNDGLTSTISAILDFGVPTQGIQPIARFTMSTDHVT